MSTAIEILLQSLREIAEGVGPPEVIVVYALKDYETAMQRYKE